MSAIDLTTFLTHILPDTGKYILAWKRNGEPKMRQTVVHSIAELAIRALALSAEGYDTYFACSAYTGEPLHAMKNGKPVVQYRTAEQVVGTKAFWTDLDCGEEKPYANFEEALADLLAWCDDYNIPIPTVVRSGYGLHAYWVMDRVMLPAEWDRIAIRLKAFTLSTDLPVDQTRTADIASVLRPPGTNNYKQGQPAPVTCGPLQPPLTVEAFAALFPEVEAPARPAPKQASNLDKYSNIYAEVPAFAERAAASCRWLHEVGQVKQGNVSEPIWYAMLGLLVFTEDGEGLVDDWSMGHPSYDYDETGRKMDQARGAQSGPTTCAKFESVWYEGCQGCPHRGTITSPIQLGRPQIPTRAQLVAAQTVAPLSVADGALDTDDTTELLDWQYGWSATGALVESKGEEDEREAYQLYPYPLLLDAMRQEELAGTAHTVLRHFRPHDGWMAANIAAGDLKTDGAFRLLANNHIEISPDRYKGFSMFLSRAKQAFTEHRRTEMQHETFGWKDDTFLIGEMLYGAAGSARAGVSEELKKYAERLGPVGQLDVWRNAAQTLFRPGYEHQAMAVLASFGAPLMRYAPYPGAIYSMISPGSGRGKTFALEAATSVWGRHQSLWVSHRDDKVSTGDTIKAQYRAMALLKNLPIGVDEMRDIDAEKLRAFITSFTDGSPPKGLNRDGTMRKIFGTWKTVLIVTANRSLVDIATGNNDPAAANRVLEVTCSLPSDAKVAEANEIRETMLKNSGTAGVRFIQALLDPQELASVRAEVSALVEKYTIALQALRAERTGGDRYIASFLACCTVAARLLNKIGLLAVDIDHLLEWVFERWGLQRTQIEEAHQPPIEVLSAYIRDIWSNVIRVNKEVKGRDTATLVDEKAIVRTPITGRLDALTGRLWVDRTALQVWCGRKNIALGDLRPPLLAADILLDANAKKGLGASTQIFSYLGQSTCWLIDTRHPAMSGQLRDLDLAPEIEPLPLHAQAQQ